jgi:hypothetical protein
MGACEGQGLKVEEGERLALVARKGVSIFAAGIMWHHHRGHSRAMSARCWPWFRLAAWPVKNVRSSAPAHSEPIYLHVPSTAPATARVQVKNVRNVNMK